MSETPCRECREYEEPVADSNGFCREHQCHVPVSCRGCDDFAKRRDRWEECRDEIASAIHVQGSGWICAPGIDSILRRHFPPVDREALWSAIFKAWSDDKQGFTDRTLRLAVDAVLAALEVRDE